MTIEAVMEALGGVDRNDVRFVLSGLATHAAGDVKRVERGVYVYDGRAEWR
jgi:predicted transcriptional regulator of viral defense system